jgi:signal transduction histidine kinase
MSDKNINILIVDDIPANLSAMEAVLWDLGWNLVKANSGRSALRQCLLYDFAVILLDVQMPEMDGFETAAMIRKHPRTEHTPIIFVTAVGKSEEFELKGYTTGAVDYIFKPFNKEILRAKVKVFVDLYRMSKEIAQQKEELEFANKELEAFSYTISHDLRAPLRAISGFIRALIDGYSEKLDDEGRHYLKRVSNGAERMSVLIEDLLTFSRLSRASVKFSEVNLSQITEEIINELKRQNPDRKTKIKIAPELIIQGDSTLMRAVMENLLGNAWKYSSKKEITDIEFGLKQEGDNIVYFVKDKGAGFDMKYASKLFGVFQRLHTTEEFEGTGVGLASVYRIIRRHDGKIWAEAQEGKGAVFYFTI